MDKKFIVKPPKSSIFNTYGVIIMLVSCFLFGISSYELINNDGEPTKNIYIVFFLVFLGVYSEDI